MYSTSQFLEKPKSFATKPKPWRINLLLYLAHEGWFLIKKYVIKKFGISKDTSYITFLDLLDNLIPATLDIYIIYFEKISLRNISIQFFICGPQ
jgi:hypothetical protein